MRTLLVTIMLLAVPPTVDIAIRPRALFAGGAIRVTCRVPRDDRNRGLEMGIGGYTSHFVQLNGSDSAITHEQLFQHIPCNVDTAFCALNSDQMIRTATFQVSGCE